MLEWVLGFIILGAISGLLGFGGVPGRAGMFLKWMAAGFIFMAILLLILF